MSNRVIIADRQQGLIGSFFSLGFAVIAGLVLSLVLSIVIEWIGIRFFWREEGASHSARMYEAEAAFLEGELDRNLFSKPSRDFAESFAATLVDWVWRKTQAIVIVEWILSPPPDDSNSIRKTLHGFKDYAEASLTMTAVYGLRLGTLVLASPLFFLAALVSIADGFVERDLRKWGGGRESGYMFHIAKRFILPIVTLFCIAMLSAPVSVNPVFMTLPAALALAVALRLTVASFKKYL